MKVEKEKIRKEWEKRGFSFGIWIDPPGQNWKNFSHDSDELFLLVKGKIEVVLEGKTFMVKIGEEIFIPKGAVHSIYNVGDTHSVWYYGYN